MVLRTDLVVLKHPASLCTQAGPSGEDWALFGILHVWVVVSNMFLFLPQIWGNDPIWGVYFSIGLKPPTRRVFLLKLLFHKGVWEMRAGKTYVMVELIDDNRNNFSYMIFPTMLHPSHCHVLVYHTWYMYILIFSSDYFNTGIYRCIDIL